jgi:hypothetical protein
VALSASKELEPGARAMILTAKDLFRLDVVVSGDTLRTVVRNLSSGELALDTASESPESFGFGEVDIYEPGVASLTFTLRGANEQVSVRATIGTLRFKQRGTVRVTAQAVVVESAGADSIGEFARGESSGD